MKNYERQEADHKLDEIVEAITTRAMPKGGYVLLHPHARLNAADEQAIQSWVQTVKLKGN